MYKFRESNTVLQAQKDVIHVSSLAMLTSISGEILAGDVLSFPECPTTGALFGRKSQKQYFDRSMELLRGFSVSLASTSFSYKTAMS